MKILVVGAGPVGSYVSRLLQKKGKNLDITVIEEHPEVGKPVHCAGLVSTKVFSEISLPSLSKNLVLNKIDGADFHFENESFRIRRKNAAFVINRKDFDISLAEGLNIDFNTKFVGIEKNHKFFIVETDKREYEADIVIGADGANSLVRKVLNPSNSIQCLRGVQFRIESRQHESNFVQVYLTDESFAWVIPENYGIVRVGILSDNPYKDLTDFIEKVGIKGAILEKFAGLVPIGSCLTQNQGLVLVGDAACQVKPLTHGGIYYGMRCAEVLADCIINSKINEYEKRWKAKFDREIQIGLKARKFYQNLSRDNKKRIFKLLKNNVKILEKFGDFENHSRVISALIKNPSLQSFFGKVFISFLRNNSIP
ncbi:MAG: NAD(P)/FAD-dependent oxidoreductase [Candidatus Omnitrophota bacterium]|jgi:geranylgeranyl reductase family protein|nr:MAG: NAD(P)/FAD-dependent oxidoreductase [Candidatus Omnitrophota bacterium]